ncbi:MAG: hypothetical protein VKL97_05825 [Cyanobacteriota bacterium]|nr:hypothetical protein [Cyanobacteriota bacterium]
MRLLHHLAAVMAVPLQVRGASGVAGRRGRQRLALSQRLIEAMPPELMPAAGSERFWRMLRWGGAGMLLAWLLQR